MTRVLDFSRSFAGWKSLVNWTRINVEAKCDLIDDATGSVDTYVLIGSGTGAVALGCGGNCCRRLSPMCRCLNPLHRSVSSLRLFKPGVRFSLTGLSCWLHLKGYGTYRLGSAFRRWS